MSYEVKSRAEAWNIANKLFPTDYEKDDYRSERAGYPIYISTMDGNSSWISDLGNRLELNIAGTNGKLKTINIWAEWEPEIKEIRSMDCYSVRSCCIKHSLYTCGTVREYDAMLQKTEEEFSLKLLYEIAIDIYEHSEDQTVTNIMSLLTKDAVTTVYEIA